MLDRDAWEGRKPLVPAMPAHDIADLDVGWLVYSATRRNADDLPLGGVVVDTGGLDRRARPQRVTVIDHLAANLAAAINSLAYEDIAPGTCRPLDRYTISRLVRRIDQHIGGGDTTALTHFETQMQRWAHNLVQAITNRTAA